MTRGDLVPHLAVTTVAGLRFDYEAIWQRRNLLLVALPQRSSAAERQYLATLAESTSEIEAYDATCVITRDPIGNLQTPAVIVADRWGEIYLAASAATVTELPAVAEIVECLRSVALQCPECEGEAR